MDDTYILYTIKKMLGVITEDDSAFDTELLIFINATILDLIQNGIGPNSGLVVDESTLWSEITNNKSDLEALKNYIFIKSKLNFDPPSNSFVQENYNKLKDEILWRLRVQAEGENQNV